MSEEEVLEWLRKNRFRQPELNIFMYALIALSVAFIMYTAFLLQCFKPAPPAPVAHPKQAWSSLLFRPAASDFGALNVLTYLSFTTTFQFVHLQMEMLLKVAFLLMVLVHKTIRIYYLAFQISKGSLNRKFWSDQRELLSKVKILIEYKITSKWSNEMTVLS